MLAMKAWSLEYGSGVHNLLCGLLSLRLCVRGWLCRIGAVVSSVGAAGAGAGLLLEGTVLVRFRFRVGWCCWGWYELSLLVGGTRECVRFWLVLSLLVLWSDERYPPRRRWLGLNSSLSRALSLLKLGAWSRGYPPRRLVLERVRHLFAATLAC